MSGIWKKQSLWVACFSISSETSGACHQGRKNYRSDEIYSLNYVCSWSNEPWSIKRKGVRPTEIDLDTCFSGCREARFHPWFFNLSAFSIFQQDVFTCVWYYADLSFLFFIKLYVITKGAARSSTMNVYLNGEAEITKFFIPHKICVKLPNHVRLKEH